jgi:kynurenine 3-monooxygenase
VLFSTSWLLALGMASQTIEGEAFEYVIIGAGPAGLAAAGHLAKVGARVAVFEGRPRPVDVFGSYPVVLNPRGLQSLERLDPALVEKSSEIGIVVDHLDIVPDNRTVASVKTFGTCIMRDQAAYILLEHADQQKNITVFWEHKLESLDIEAHSCTFKAGSTTVVLNKIARLVAADGNRSRIRQACVSGVAGFEVEEDAWGFQLRFMTSKGKPDQTEVDPKAHYVLGDKGYVCQQPNGIWNVSLRVLPGYDEDFLTSNEASEENIAGLKKYCESHAGMAFNNLLDDEAYREYYEGRAFDGLVVKCSCLNPAGWICMIGDAAHAVMPATGEGINSGLEDASVLGACARDHPEDPFAAFDTQHRANAHALQKIALQSKEKVVSSPRQRTTNLMVTIGLGIAKKLNIIEGTCQDFMLGELAKTVGVKSYAELVEMEDRQSRGIRKFARGVTKVFRVSEESPADVVARKQAEESSKTQENASASAVPQQASGA